MSTHYEIKESLYNRAVDALSKLTKEEGYTLLKSYAYPEAGESKYIVWANSERKKAVRLFWNIEEDILRFDYGQYETNLDADNIAFYVEYYEELFDHETYTDHDDIISTISQQFIETNQPGWKREKPKNKKPDIYIFWTVISLIMTVVGLITGKYSLNDDYDGWRNAKMYYINSDSELQEFKKNHLIDTAILKAIPDSNKTLEQYFNN